MIRIRISFAVDVGDLYSFSWGRREENHSSHVLLMTSTLLSWELDSHHIKSEPLHMPKPPFSVSKLFCFWTWKMSQLQQKGSLWILWKAPALKLLFSWCLAVDNWSVETNSSLHQLTEPSVACSDVPLQHAPVTAYLLHQNHQDGLQQRGSCCIALRIMWIHPVYDN